MCGAKSAALFAPVRLNGGWLRARARRTARAVRRGATRRRRLRAAPRVRRSRVTSMRFRARGERRVRRSRRRRRDAGNAPGRPERARALLREFFARLARERGDAPRSRSRPESSTRSVLAAFSMRQFLPAHVAFALELDRDAFADRRIERRVEAAGDVVEPTSRTAQRVGERRARRRMRSSPMGPAPTRVRSARSMPSRSASRRASNAAHARVVDQPGVAAERRQARVGVVVAQQDAMLGARGEHAIGFVDAFGDEIVDHHADVRLAAREPQRLGAARRARRVDAGDQALAPRLLRIRTFR